jgi:hypothetical protein
LTGFNPKPKIPLGVTTQHVRLAMNDFIEFVSVKRDPLQIEMTERVRELGSGAWPQGKERSHAEAPETDAQ